MNRLVRYWTWDWGSLLIILALIIVYLWFHRMAIKQQSLSFIIALFLLIICFFSPLQILSGHYLFSAHMAVHVILLLLAGPLLLLSLHQNAFHRFFSFLVKYPFIAWITGVSIMWIWHIPAVFNKSMANMHSGTNWMMVIETLSLLIAGIIFSAPVIHADKKKRINALNGVVYLFTACIGCSVLGILISFAPEGTYHHYLSMHDMYGLNKIITNQWNLSQVADQQIAGLIMWVPCCLIYVSGAMYLLFNWFSGKEIVTEDFLIN